ncbi:MAG: anthranilate phosphoribosyltransferase [Verrucomicrobiota bacterium]
MAASALNDITDTLKQGKDLSAEAAAALAVLLAEGVGSLQEREELLLALEEKGACATEIAAFAQIFRDLARDPELGEAAAEAFDFAGTGGDKSGTANISTMSSFLVASLGVPVVKHGNRSITSKCGSADLVAALGFPLDAENETLAQVLKETDFTFLFAQAFHPAWKHIIEVRKSLAAKGHRTIFNILGPLVNPARTPYQVMGVYARHWVEILAEAMDKIGVARGLVVHGEPVEGGALDELSCAGINRVAGAGELTGLQESWKATSYGLSPCVLADLQGGTLERNCEILDQLARGEATQGLTDTVIFNAAVALWVAGQAKSPDAAISNVRDHLEAGGLQAWLKRFKNCFA